MFFSPRRDEERKVCALCEREREKRASRDKGRCGEKNRCVSVVSSSEEEEEKEKERERERERDAKSSALSNWLEKDRSLSLLSLLSLSSLFFALFFFFRCLLSLASWGREREKESTFVWVVSI